MSEVKRIIENKLNTRTTSQLKEDIKTAMKSESEESGIIFVLGLNVLENRISETEYELFEDSL